MAARKKSEKMQVMEAEVKPVSAKESKWMGFGWVLLLVGGLAHMLPVQMAPVVGWSVAGVTMQTAVGVLSVIFALYYLLGE